MVNAGAAQAMACFRAQGDLPAGLCQGRDSEQSRREFPWHWQDPQRLPRPADRDPASGSLRYCELSEDLVSVRP